MTTQAQPPEDLDDNGLPRNAPQVGPTPVYVHLPPGAWRIHLTQDNGPDLMANTNAVLNGPGGVTITLEAAT
jgi:hypothetical protein